MFSPTKTIPNGREGESHVKWGGALKLAVAVGAPLMVAGIGAVVWLAWSNQERLVAMEQKFVAMQAVDARQDRMDERLVETIDRINDKIDYQLERTRGGKR